VPPSPSNPKSKPRRRPAAAKNGELPVSIPQRRRVTAEGFGRRGEWWAALFLRLQLYTIVAERVRTPVGEIDIIAERFGVTVFVEVKSRASLLALEEALLAVNRRRVVRAAQYYITRHAELAATPLRFDVIFLAPFAWPRHVRGAFDAS
jgi:putative endonuclease